jgi:endonuclease I
MMNVLITIMFSIVNVLKHTKPILYTNAKHNLNIEHIVPRSVLKHYSKNINDPHNLYPAARYYNSVRSNYRFAFERPTDTMIHVGEGNYVCHKYRIFTPRIEDWGSILMAIQYCHITYGVPYNKVMIFPDSGNYNSNDAKDDDGTYLI